MEEQKQEYVFTDARAYFDVFTRTSRENKEEIFQYIIKIKDSLLNIVDDLKITEADETESLSDDQLKMKYQDLPSSWVENFIKERDYFNGASFNKGIYIMGINMIVEWLAKTENKTNQEFNPRINFFQAGFPQMFGCGNEEMGQEDSGSESSYISGSTLDSDSESDSCCNCGFNKYKDMVSKAGTKSEASEEFGTGFSEEENK